MFYSQFILAKKGPLGTIWIAAHLERKLRKNQVADTDIGESVDSILFPDVPIALRLSSHLLLGVVRIYSRKVNYLFHDCSEALLKIKQAFRSTAVDLPPEESTAPYHSITLPETFDLDDFELPDSALLSGNFVDHHVSTREQITLQDTVDATGYSTSQFGLDERFGDGDASQIRLDLDEDVVLDKGSAADHISNLLGSGDVDGEIPGQPETPFPDMDIDGCQNDCDEEQNAETAKDIPECFADDLGRPVLQNVQNIREENPSADGYNVETPCLHEEISHGDHVGGPHAVPDDVTVTQMLPDSTENAQAPSTPGLMQEAIPANVQENPALSPSGKASPSNDTEVIVVNAAQSSHIESDSHVPNENDISNVMCKMLSPSSILEQPEIVTPASQPLVLSLTTADRSNPPCGDSAGAADSCQDNDTLASNSVSFLRPCDTKMNQSDITSSQDDTNDLLPKESDVADGKEQLHTGGSSAELQDADVHWKSGQVHTPEAANLNMDVLSPNEIPNDARLEINYSASSDYPEPEKMLFAAGGDTDVAIDLGQCIIDFGQCSIDFGQCTTIEKGVIESDANVDEVKSTRGRKRPLAEGTPVLLNGDSAKSSKPSQLGRTTDYIPDDDDVLASILVGRSSALKMKPTPTLSAMPPSKRTRVSGKSGVPKRKVLMDDTMVLHPDAIRQQLINTEDIRRTRRKAPCTNSEIWMIQKCSVEEIFNEPVLTGVTVELVALHSQAYDPNEIPYSNCPDVELPNVMNRESSGFVEEARVNEIAIVTDKNDDERQEFIDVLRSAQTMTRPLECDADDQRESLWDVCQPEVSSGNHQGPDIPTEPENCKVINIEAQEPLVSAPCSEGMSHLSADAITEIMSIDKQDGSGEMNSGLPLHEDQQLLLASSQFCKEFVEMNANVEVSRDDMLIYTEEGSTAGDVSLSYPKDSDLDVCKAVNDDVPVSMVENCSTEVEVAFINNASALEADTSTSVQDVEIPACNQINMTNSSCIPRFPTMEQGSEGNMDSGIDGQVVAEDDNGKPKSEDALVNVAQVAMSDSQPTNTGLQDDPLTVGENTSIQDVMMGTGQLDNSAPRDFNVQDFCSAMGENDTDFLNVDDEADFDEEVDNEVPNTEESQSIENSGWSTRTRGVARYLRSLFDDESGLRKTTVAMDHLLVGKTRKEASRMFFETLVLKTKDFIHVEQENPFRNINIQPKSNLLKSEF